jgi:hypothetical protein
MTITKESIPKKMIFVRILSLVKQQESEAIAPGIFWVHHLARDARLGPAMIVQPSVPMNARYIKSQWISFEDVNMQ